MTKWAEQREDIKKKSIPSFSIDLISSVSLFDRWLTKFASFCPFTKRTLRKKRRTFFFLFSVNKIQWMSGEHLDLCVCFHCWQIIWLKTVSVICWLFYVFIVFFLLLCSDRLFFFFYFRITVHFNSKFTCIKFQTLFNVDATFLYIVDCKCYLLDFFLFFSSLFYSR